MNAPPVKPAYTPDYASPLPEPPTWDSLPLTKPYIWHGKANSEKEMKQLVLAKKVPTAIADAGASVTCGAPIISECGRYSLSPDPFIPTGRMSDKVLQYAGGNIAKAGEIKEMPLNIRKEAREVHMVPGIQNNLFSTNALAKAGYIQIFDNEQVNVYDSRNTKITVSRGAVLRGWHLPNEGLWRIPLVKQAHDAINLNTDTVLVTTSPSKILAQQPPPTKILINNVYDLRTKPELIR